MKLDDIHALIRAAREAIGSGILETAETIAASILLEHPANIDALEIRALVEVQRGELAAAEKTLRSAITIAPDRRWHYADLARLLITLERKQEVEEVARSALAVDPRNPDAHAMLGTMLAERGLVHEAAEHFERAIAAAGPHPQLLTGLGRARLGQGRLEEARTPLQAAANADPAQLEPAVALAELEERLGRFEQAKEQLDRAERIAMANGTDVDLQRSVLLARTGALGEALTLLERRSELSGAALLQRGRLLDHLGRHAKAWSDWTSGKAILADKAGRHYRAAEVESAAKMLSSFVDAAGTLELARAGPRQDVPQPLFIIGFPRSGTTLTEQILASHSNIRAGGELPFGSEVFDLAISLAGGEGGFPIGLAALPDWPTRLRDHYLARAEQYGLLEASAAYFTDKMPDNSFWLPLLRVAFPQSPVIYVRRHPLDVLTSVMAHDMTHGFNCGYRLEDAARHMALVDDLMETYRGSIHELRYEALVADQAGETERLMASIGLSMEPGQLHFHERGEVSPTPSYAQVQEPLNDRSIGRWRNYAAQLEAVRPIVASAMARGDYAG